MSFQLLERVAIRVAFDKIMQPPLLNVKLNSMSQIYLI